MAEVCVKCPRIICVNKELGRDISWLSNDMQTRRSSLRVDACPIRKDGLGFMSYYVAPRVEEMIKSYSEFERRGLHPGGK